MENKPTNRGKMSNKQCIRARLQYLQHSYKASEATSLAACFTLVVFLADLLDSTLQIFSLKNKIHKIWLKITGSAHSQTTNKLVNKAADDSARVSVQDRKKPPALGTNQIAGFGGFHPFASLEKNKKLYVPVLDFK